MDRRPFDIEEKRQQLKMRADERRALGKQVDDIVRRAERPPDARCTSGGCFAFARRLFGSDHKAMRVANSVRAAVDATSTASTSSASTDFNRAVFGLAGVKKGDPAAKLEEAAALMRTRIDALEGRAREQRAQAVQLQQSGQKAAALRALKKAKQVEAQVVSNQSALDAVEQQVDMLAQATMHKTLTSALATTSKAMKGDAKLLSKAECAIDAATEARDVATDLSGVMAEFAHSGAGGDMDEDELEAELALMVQDDQQPTPPPDAARLAEIAELERKIQVAQERKDAREVAKSMPAAPREAPKSRKQAVREEKAGLLATAG